jgi:hypothetical protein
LKGIKVAELPAYLNGGAECFLNVDDSLIGNASCLEFIYLHIQKYPTLAEVLVVQEVTL